MTPEQIRDYANRDWALLARYKASYWAEQDITPAARGRIAAELYKQVRARRPDWPIAAEREADLEAQVRLCEKLRAAGQYLTQQTSQAPDAPSSREPSEI